MGASDFKKEMYEAKKIDAIYNNLLARQQAGTSHDFEIEVDGFPAVGKTSDLERFMTYADFINPDTKHITVKTFRSNGQPNKFFFYLDQQAFQEAKELRGISHSQGASALNETELTAKIKKDLHYEEVLKENVRLQSEIKEYEGIFRNMEQELENEKAGKKLTFGRVGAYLLEGAISSQFVQEKFPGIKNLSGFGNTESTPKDETASFRRKEKEQTEDGESSEEIYISDKEKKYLELIKHIREKFGEVELAHVMHLLDLVGNNPQCVHYATKMVSNYLKQKPETTQNTTDEKI